MEKVSVIIPVYNGEKYLERCVNSLINQTYTNIELIFINDGSIDNSIQILKKYNKKDKRIIIIDKKNTGVSDSRNLGIKKSTGRYICFCDCDDTYEHNYIEIMYNTITKYKTDIVRCNYKIINKDNIESLTPYKNLKCNKTYTNKEIKKIVIPKCLSGEIPCFSTLILIDKTKLTTEYPLDISMMEDVVFYIRLLLKTEKIHIINDALYRVYFNDESATNNIKNYKRNILNIINVNQYIKSDLEKNKILTKENIENLNINHLNAISDFIFKYYLYKGKDTILLCKEIREPLLKILATTDLKKLNIQRRIIMILIKIKKYLLLKTYFITRKIIFKLRRR